jgi:hypothetical protein
LTETRYTDPDRTVVTDSDGWAATFTDNARTVAVRGPTRTFRQQMLPFSDAFNRVISSGWGSCPAGGVWYSSGGSDADYSVDTDHAVIQTTSANVSRRVTVSNTIADPQVVMSCTTSKAPTGAAQVCGVVLCYADADNLYLARLYFDTDGSVNAYLRRRLAGVETTLATATVGTGYTPGQKWWIRAALNYPTLTMRAWADSTSEPSTWTLTASDTTFTSGRVGVRAISNTGTSNLPVTYTVYSFAVDGGHWPDSYAPTIRHGQYVHLLDAPFSGTVDYDWLETYLDVAADDILAAAAQYVGGASLTVPASAAEARPYSDLTVGRLTLTEDCQVTQQAGTDRTMSLRMTEASAIEGSQRAVRELSEGLLAMRGKTVPVIGTVMAHHAGWWTINRVTSREYTWWDTTIIEWGCDLTRVGRTSEVEVESQLIGGDRTHDSDAISERWHAPSCDADSYYVDADTPGWVDRTSADGTVRVYREIPSTAHPRWGTSAAGYLSGAVTVTVDGYVRTGMTCEDTPDDWVLSNGLVMVQPSDATGTLIVTSYLAAGWGTGKVFDLKRGTVSLGPASHVTVVRNDFCECILRLTWDHVPGRSTCDLSLKRGARFVQMHLQQYIAPSSLRVDDNGGGGTVSDQLTAFGYIHRTDADADGNRWLIGSPIACTAAGTFGLAATVAATSLPAYIGVERRGASAIPGDLAAQVNAQYLGTPAETERVILR